MKKQDLKSLALMGIAGGAILASQEVNASLPDLKSQEALAALSWTCRKGNCGMAPKAGLGDSSCGAKNGCNGWGEDRGAPSDPAQSERQFVLQLNEEGRRLYNSLDDEGKHLALRLAKQYTDKNQAVKQAAKQMARQNAQSPPKN